MNGFKIPEVPELKRDRSVPENTRTTTDTDTRDGRDFVPRTLKTTIWVVVIGAVILGGMRRYELVMPFLLGAGLGAILLAGLEAVVRKSFTSDVVLAEKGIVREADTQNNKKKFGGKAAILVFALIKYPLVALLLWVVARYFSQTQVIAFVGGFITLQIIIGLRGLGGFLFPQIKAK